MSMILDETAIVNALQERANQRNETKTKRNEQLNWSWYSWSLFIWITFLVFQLHRHAKHFDGTFNNRIEPDKIQFIVINHINSENHILAVI